MMPPPCESRHRPPTQSGSAPHLGRWCAVEGRAPLEPSALRPAGRQQAACPRSHGFKARLQGAAAPAVLPAAIRRMWQRSTG